MVQVAYSWVARIGTAAAAAAAVAAVVAVDLAAAAVVHCCGNYVGICGWNDPTECHPRPLVPGVLRTS